MKKNSSIKKFFLCLLMVFSVTFLASQKADAASFQRSTRETKVGGYYVWGDYSSNTLRISGSKSGSGKLLAKPSKGRRISSLCLSNGSVVYYSELSAFDRNGNSVGYIYKIQTGSKKKTYLGKLRNVCSIDAYYGNKLYVSCSPSSDPTVLHTYELDLKTKKSRCVMKNTQVLIQQGQYLIGSPNTGAIVPLPLYSYNCKTGKRTQITKTCGGYQLVGKKIYYTEYLSEQSVSTFRIRSCNPSGSGKKTVLKSLKASSVGKLSSRYIYYYIYDRGFKYYRYDLKTKKSSRVSSSQYQYR